MIFFFGTRSTHLTSKHFEHTVCPECGQKGHIHCSIFGNYGHVFWIPIFPYTKEIVAQCMYCKRQYTPREMPPDMAKEAYELRTSARTPIWQWLGLILVGFFIINFMFFAYRSNKEKNEKNQTYIEAPQILDVYSYKNKKDGKTEYSLMRVEGIQNDTVYFADNNYATNYSSDVLDLNVDSYYDRENIIYYTLSELKTLLEENKIMEIHRNLPVLPEEVEQRGPVTATDDE